MGSQWLTGILEPAADTCGCSSMDQHLGRLFCSRKTVEGRRHVYVAPSLLQRDLLLSQEFLRFARN